MDFKHIPLDLKFDAEGSIEGYGSVFDVEDQGGEIVAKGAFKASLKSGRKVKMLFQHDPSALIGVWDSVAEDGHGLRVKGHILPGIQAGREALELARAGALDGLSIGYRTVKSAERAGKRVIMEADLWEVSLVTFPMNEMTRIDAVKAAALSARDLERVLTRDAGLSRSVALRLMAGGYDAVKSMRDAGDEGDIGELAALVRAKLKL